MDSMKNDLIPLAMDEEIQGQAQIWKHIYGFAESLTLKCAIELGVPDILHKHGKPMTLSEIADKLTIPSPNMDRFHRIMRFLVHMKLFTVIDGPEMKYALTPASKLLVRAEEKNLVSFALIQLHADEMLPWHYLIAGIEGQTTPWLASHNGVPYYDRVGKDPEYYKLHNDAMTSHTSFVVSALVQGCAKEGVLDGVRSLVDVGGSTGVASKAITNAFPHVKCTVMDFAHVVEAVPKDPKVDFVAGDVFDCVPKADAVLMKSFLHGFDDDDSIKILNKCREAIPAKGGKLIIVEIVVDIDGTLEFARPRLCMDLELGMFGGKERTKDEWKNLLTKAETIR
ncbi:hypothetical protein MRB53_027352 [Persea americana]|uniref:Uncharacterized protein n=1 Tax=Persea americana TaxID=3435 RepID=A0ACC2LKL9_PERAE|nr:hypothetical protein MRB53_027352 [Persea americana]